VGASLRAVALGLERGQQTSKRYPQLAALDHCGVDAALGGGDTFGGGNGGQTVEVVGAAAGFAVW
jgi:hypothetical protein